MRNVFFAVVFKKFTNWLSPLRACFETINITQIRIKAIYTTSEKESVDLSYLMANFLLSEIDFLQDVFFI